MPDVDEAAARIHDTIQACINDGLLAPGMLTDWYLAAHTIDTDGDPCTILLADNQATTPRSLGLIEIARLSLQRDVTEWLDT